jgi:6-phosphogluconolactonase
MRFHVYVTVSGEGRIARFAMDADTGALEHKADYAAPGRPAPVAVSPDRRFMYVARRDDLMLASYAIDRASGDLAPLNAVPTETDPCHLATDRSGRWLLSAHYLGETAAVHGIAGDGSVRHPAVEWRHTGRGAHCFQTDRSNRFAFVPHIDGNGAPNAVFQFRFDASTGKLTANEPPQVKPAGADGPRHFCFHPARDIVYVSNEQGGSASVYDLDAKAGTLALRQTVSTLPEGWSGRNLTSQIQMTPDGRFLYVPNRGHDSLAEFAVSARDGSLTALGRAPAEKTPRAFGIDPNGRFLVSAGLDSGRLATYRIDAGSGHLERIATTEVGKLPMWVSILPAG